MPQMSPLSWTTLVIMLMLFVLMTFNNFNQFSSTDKSKLMFKNKEINMKW